MCPSIVDGKLPPVVMFTIAPYVEPPLLLQLTVPKLHLTMISFELLPPT